ncbi:MAG TPA: hypothetical protein VIP46_19215 [Pyrinomonadaceae bacterium]
MARISRRAIPFIALGTAFLGVGVTGRRVFLYLGIVFLALGIAFVVKRSRGV